MMADAPLRVVALDFLANDEAACRAAYLAGCKLQQLKFMPYPAACWDEPAVVAFSGDECVAAVNYSYDEKERNAVVQFAFCEPEHPKALMLCLLRFRAKLKEKPVSLIRFTHHVGNLEMERAVAKLGLAPHSLSYRIPFGKFARAIADTHPKDGDVKQAPLVSGGGAGTAIAQPQEPTP